MDNKFSGPERRKSRRVKVDFTVIYQVRKPLEVIMKIGNRVIHAVMLDLSEAGMAIVTSYDIPAGTELSLKFSLFNPHAIGDERVREMQILGDVRYNLIYPKDERRLGICFTQISESDKAAIVRFVRMTHR